MKQDQTKSNKLLILMKKAVREVIKEELTGIIKTVMSESANTFRNTIIEPSITPQPYTRKSNATQRVFFEDTANPQTKHITEAANNIKDGKFNLNDLKNIVSEDSDINDPIGDVSNEQVDSFINKVFG